MYCLEHTAVFSRKLFILNFWYLFDVMVKLCVLEKIAEMTFETRQTVFGTLCDRKDPELLKNAFLNISFTMLAVVSVTICTTFEIQACTEDKISPSPCFFCISTPFALGRL